MDALPIREANSFDYRSKVDGVFHGCGHDGHTSMLLGAARHLAEKDRFSGVVYFVFQPAEEWGKGAPAMIEDGLFQKFPMREIYGMHNWPSLPLGRFAIRSGPMMAAEDNFEIVVRGRGGHASAPHLCRDPLVAAAEIIAALQTIVSRGTPPYETCVVSATEFVTDGARNVIPSNVTIRGDVRTFSTSVSNTVKERMAEIVAGICAAHNVAGDFNYTHEFAVLVNSPEETRHAICAARDVVGEEYVDANIAPITASEDFAWMLRETPGAYILIGGGRPDGGSPSLHNPLYDFPDEILATGAKHWIRLVESRLSAP